MTKSQKVKLITSILNEFFPNPEIPLSHFSPFTLLVAVVLSARSTDRMVNRITPHLFEIASTPDKMAALPYETLRNLIKPCGLSPQKAKALIALAKILLEKYEGKVPETFEELESLPGVGHKTASVVMAEAFHVPAFPVDTHIFRSARRWGLSSGKSVKKVEEDLKKLFPKKEWIKLHLQIIYYARAFCPALGHKEENCQICKRIKQ